MSANDMEREAPRFRFDDKLRGAAILALGSAALIGIAFAAMAVLTSPDGWVTKAANNAIADDQATAVSFYEPAPLQ